MKIFLFRNRAAIVITALFLLIFFIPSKKETNTGTVHNTIPGDESAVIKETVTWHQSTLYNLAYE